MNYNLPSETNPPIGSLTAVFVDRTEVSLEAFTETNVKDSVIRAALMIKTILVFIVLEF